MGLELGTRKWSNVSVFSRDLRCDTAVTSENGKSEGGGRNDVDLIVEGDSYRELEK